VTRHLTWSKSHCKLKSCTMYRYVQFFTTEKELFLNFFYQLQIHEPHELGITAYVLMVTVSWGVLTCAILSCVPPRAATFALFPVARHIRHETCAPTRGAGGRAEMSAPSVRTQLLPIASSAAVGVILFAAAGRAPPNRFGV
jgi:hypothetical protein